MQGRQEETTGPWMQEGDGRRENREVSAQPGKIWQEYEKARNFNNAIDLYETVEKNEDFYVGNQWRGVNAPDLDKPVMNILARVVKFFIASIVSDDIGVSVTDFEEAPEKKPLLDMLGGKFDEIMELMDFKKKTREVIRNAAVDGDGCLHYYFDPEAGGRQPMGGTPGMIVGEIVENTDVHFGNPQLCDVQRQPYILMNFRRMVQEVKERALQPEAVEPDEDDDKYGDAPEEGKVTVIRKYWKKRGPDGRKTVWYCDVTRGAVVQDETDTGLERYPVAFMPWEKVKNQFHGQAAITGMIPNQIFINKLFAMAMQHVKRMAFPKVIYNRTMMTRGWNNRVGEAIPVNGDPNIAVAGNFRAQDMSAQVLQMIEAVIRYTRDTMGASDAALGNVKPDNTSAIVATQQATSMPLELQKQDFYSFVEESVRTWLDMMAAYYGTRAVKMTISVPVPLSVEGQSPERLTAAMQGTPGNGPAQARDWQGPTAMPSAPAPGMGGMASAAPLPAGSAGMGAMQSGALPEAEQEFTETILFDFTRLRGMDLQLNVEIGAATYWSELMQVQTLDNLFKSGILQDAVVYLENMPRGYIPGKANLIKAIKEQQHKQEQAAVLQAQTALPGAGAVPGAVRRSPRTK